MSKEKTFTTENGTVLRLKAVRQPLIAARLKALEAEYRLQHPELVVPTYIARTAAGDQYEIELDADSLVDPSDPIATKINRARWQKHLAAIAEWEAIQVEQEHLTWLMLGVECDLPEGWEAQVTELGINLPADPLQRKALWLHYFALAPGDMQLLRADLQIISVGNVITNDQVESFRSSAKRALENEARTRFDDALGALTERALVGGAEGERAGDGESVGANTEPVGQAQS